MLHLDGMSVGGEGRCSRVGSVQQLCRCCQYPFGQGTDEAGFGSIMEEVGVTELGQENEARTQGERRHVL